MTSPAGPSGDLDVPAPPSHVDPTVGRASRAIGGSWGRYAGVWPGTWWTPVRILLALTSITLLLGFAQKSPCASGDWTGNKQYTHMCYSDIVPLWSDERIDVGAVPYRDTAVEYPVLTGGFMWLAGDLTRAAHGLDSGWSELVVYVAITSLLLAACGLVVSAGTAGAAGRRPYDAAIFALSPLLVFHAFSNWDLFAMALTSGALWAWARRKPVLAGALIGLGTAAKLYPVFLLVALAVLAYRTRRYAPTVWAGASAAAVWAAVNVPVALAYPHAWWQFYRFSADRYTERSTLWAMGKTIATSGFNSSDNTYWVPPGALVALALVVALAGVVWLALRAPHRPRLGQLAFLVVLAFLLTTKVWSPQYSLWLVPLLALARPRWRLSLIWQFTEILVWIMTLTLLLGDTPGQQGHGIGYGWLMLVLLVRDGLLLAIAALVVREMWRPELDIVRSGGMDDPAGGCFDGAADRPRRPAAEELPQGPLVTDTGSSR
ncbi:MAG: glycosyltransferase family 87 protein [Jatrophihabitantaceae bacterium]